uniref:Serpin domain-containing protein n=1 Tax=Timema tahoe TaxID=61484 RepID=A0A7R9I9B1_9NEOP|nr:unnamed protein product [Timema tahoe]
MRFASVAQRYFKSMVVREDFQNNTSVAIADINSWVARVTKNTITELVGPESLHSCTPGNVLCQPEWLILHQQTTGLDVMSLPGFWAAPFKPFLTKPCLFYIDTNNSITVSMMHQKGNFLYYDNHQLNSQILALNYQTHCVTEKFGALGIGPGTPEYVTRKSDHCTTKGNTMRLLIILPKQRDGLANLEKSFRRLDDLQLDKLNYTYINASIPKFEISYSKDFKSALQKLGMLAAFTPCADFSGISSYSDIFISSVLQKAYLKVDEAGTEAAAVSAVMMVRSSLRLTPANMVNFNMDHPFLFMVQHIYSKTIVFYGRVRRPSLA